jgi:hypothetical protein
LDHAVALALPLGIVQLPALRAASLRAWLARRGLSGLADVGDRPLRAGLVALAGHGLVFLDGTDPPDERRFSLAHEVAHFLADYWWPRQRAARQLGPACLEVLDGLRRPTRAERIDAVLAGAALGTHVHLMERTPDGHPAGAALAEAERFADALALELLAPAELAAQVEPAGPDPAGCLRERFGLPLPLARAYADRLWPGPPGSSAFLLRLGLDSPSRLSNFEPAGRKEE